MNASQQAHLGMRKKKKRKPLSHTQMKKVFQQEIEGLVLELSIAISHNATSIDTRYLRGKIIALREMRVKLGLGEYTYYSELLKGVLD